MNGGLVQRQLGLAGVAFLAVLATAALAREDRGEVRPTSEVVGVERGTWQAARVGTYGSGFLGRTTECGLRLTAKTRGVSHSVLPCGAKIVVSYRGRRVRATVVDRGAVATGHDFELTEALAADLGVRGVARVRWRFASG